MTRPRVVLSSVLKDLVQEDRHHDPRHQAFTLQDSEGCEFCFACGWEAILSTELNIRRRAIALEMLKILRSLDAELLGSLGGLVTVGLACIPRVLGDADEHLSLALLELTSVMQPHAQDYSSCLESIQFQLLTSTWKQSLSVLVFLGRLIRDPLASLELIKSHMPLIEHLVSALSYPDEEVRGSATFIFNQLMGAEMRDKWFEVVKDRFISTIVELLAKAQTEAVQSNILALLYSIISSGGAEDIHNSGKVGDLVKGLKPKLLSPMETQRALSMMILEGLCRDLPDIVTLMNEGLIDFILEAATKTSISVLKAATSILLRFSDHPSWNSHIQFGFDSVMRVIRNIIEHLPNQGLTILIRTLSFFTKPLDREALELIEGTILLGTTNDAELTTLSCLSLLKLLDVDTNERLHTTIQRCWDSAIEFLTSPLHDTPDQNLLRVIFLVFVRCAQSPHCDRVVGDLVETYLSKLMPYFLSVWQQVYSTGLSIAMLNSLLLSFPLHLPRIRSIMGAQIYDVILSLRCRAQGETDVLCLINQIMEVFILDDISWCSPDLKKTINENLSSLPGDVEDMLAMLSEKNHSALSLQFTILVMFYSTLKSNFRIVKDERLMQALLSFFKAYSDSVYYYTDIVQVLTFLVAVVQPFGTGSEISQLLTHIIVFGRFFMQGKPSLSTIRWLWQNPELRGYNEHQLALWLSESSGDSYHLSEWTEIVLSDSNGPSIVMDLISKNSEHSCLGVLLVDACLDQSPSIASQFVSLDLMSSLERLMKLRVSNWSPSILRSIAACTKRCLEFAGATSLVPALHIVALLSREMHTYPLPDELVLMMLHSCNLILHEAGLQQHCDEVLRSMTQAEKLLDLVCSSLKGDYSKPDGLQVVASAMVCWAQLVTLLTDAIALRQQYLLTIQQLIRTVSVTKFTKFLTGNMVLLRLIGSHCLLAFLYATANNQIEGASYYQIREHIVIVQNNLQAAQDEVFRLASVDCLSALMDTEARMTKGRAPSEFPWNRFISENIIGSLLIGPPSPSDILFLTLMVKYRPKWLGEILVHSAIESLLLQFACSTSIPHIVCYVDLFQEMIKADLIVDTLHNIAVRTIQRQIKDTAVLATQTGEDSMELCGELRSPGWREIEGVILPHAMIWPKHLTNISMDDVSRRLIALHSQLASSQHEG